MEKKKLLLIAVSLGIFLVIVIGLSILIFAPKKDNTMVYTPTSGDTTRAGATTPAIMSDTPSGGSLPASSPSTLPDNGVYIYGDTPARSAGTGAGTSGPSVTVEIAPPATVSSAQGASSTSAASATSAQGASSTSVASATSAQPITPKVSSNAPVSSASVATKTAPTPAAAAAIRPATTTSTPASTQSATRTTTQTVPATTQSATTTVAPASTQSATRTTTQTVPATTQSATTQAATASTQSATTTRQTQPASSSMTAQTVSASVKKPYEAYWVQAGAFSTQIWAEDVKETLKTKGLAAIIETRDVNGKNFYRVRVGPYTSQNEADYWLALIKSIDGFEESQIWQNNAVR